METTPNRPDYCKTLPVLQQEWQHCVRCDLGVRREATPGAHFVFGRGQDRGVMFIGEGPGKNEEQEGAPFVGRSGKILRHAIERLGFPRYYITNIVCCRSCGVQYDSEGKPVMTKDYKTGVEQPRIGDKPPTPGQSLACLPRLHQEIYLVDPVLIVALGSTAAEVLASRSVRMQTEAGQPLTISIPGASHIAHVTAKKKQWGRKMEGTMRFPTEQGLVQYLMVPVLHPSYVARKVRDARPGNAVQLFAASMRKVARMYERYMFEVYGDRTPLGDLSEDDVANSTED